MTDETAKEFAAAMRDLAAALNNVRAMFPAHSLMGPTIYHQHSHAYPQPTFQPVYPYVNWGSGARGITEG